MRLHAWLLVMIASALLSSCAGAWGYEARRTPAACSAALVAPQPVNAKGATLVAVTGGYYTTADDAEARTMGGGYYLDDLAMAALASEAPALRVQLEQCMVLRGGVCAAAEDAEAEIARLRAERAWVVVGAAGGVVLVALVAVAGGG